MQSPSEHWEGESGDSGQPDPSHPWNEDQIAGILSGHEGEDFRVRNEQIAKAVRQRTMLDGLFSDDPRCQYAALRGLDSAQRLPDRLYKRIQEIRSDTPHLLIAEAAAKLLEEKPHESQYSVSEETRREIAALIEAQEERERQRLRKATREPSVIQVPGVSLVQWLVCAAAVGSLFGGLGVYAMLSRREAQHAASDEVYLDTRSGTLLCVDEDSSQQTPERGYEPAYYCWKCKQWLPVRQPRKLANSIEGPRQSLADRPLTPRLNRNPNGK